MYYLSQLTDCFAYVLETFGLYEPELTIKEARKRLSKESKLWVESQADRKEFWLDFQSNSDTIGSFHPLVQKAILHLEHSNISTGVAVDLGCGINTTVFNLLERGWKVYAVDNSDSVIKNIKQAVSSMKKNWIENGQLVLVNQSIEAFDFPEKVHLITATDSLPYSDPKKNRRNLL